MNRLRIYLPYIILLGLGIWILDGSFGRVIQFANDYFFGDSEDSYKNYFIPAYYLKYDSGTHFSGMNYPYGEHVVFTDNQPIISWGLRLVQNIIPISDYVPAIFNWLMIFSLLGAMWWMFLILRRMKLPDWYAIPMAILISTLTPQLHRFVGHYALAYAFLIPMLWYVMLKHSDAQRPWLNLSVIIGLISVYAFLHVYHLLMGGLFAAAFFLVKALGTWKENRRSFWIEMGKAFLVFAVPILIFQIFLALTDPITDRPGFPYGFFEFRATLSSVFLPVMGPFWEAWNRFFHHKMAAIEAFSYVGLTATIVGVLTLIRSGNYAWRGFYKRILTPAFPKGMKTSLGAALLVLMFSMGIPFIWGLEFLPEHLGPLRQFRSLGRFAWVFYYVFTAYAAWYLYVIFRRIKQKGLPAFAYGLLFFAMGFWFWESAIQLQTHVASIKNHRDTNALKHDQTDYRAILDSIGVEVEDFQAILPIPAYHMASDKFVPRFLTKQILTRSFKLSYETGLPLMGGVMSRTSLGHTKKLIQVLSNKRIRKDILDDLPNQKPILILKQDKTPITLSQQRVVHRAKLLYEGPGFSFLQMDLDQLEADTEGTERRFQTLFADSTRRWGEFVVHPVPKWMYVDMFDSTKGSTFGEEFAYVEEGPLELFSGSLPPNQKMHVSIWLKIDPRIAGFPVMFFREFDQEGNQVFAKDFPSMFGNEIYGDWQLIEGTFQTKHADHRIELVFEGEKIGVESLIIKPSGTEIFLPLEGKHKMMFNNYYIE